MMNKESKKLTVGDVLQFPKWSPLSEMVGVADASRFIGRNLYKLSGGLYPVSYTHLTLPTSDLV